MRFGSLVRHLFDGGLTQYWLGRSLSEPRGRFYPVPYSESYFAMKTLIVFAFAVAFSMAPASAADGKVSHPSLAKMGLSGMKHMTDQQGSSIRGRAVLYPPQPIIGRIDRIIAADLRILWPPTPIIGKSGR